MLGVVVLPIAVTLTGCGNSSNADNSFDCGLATAAEVTAATGTTVTSSTTVTSDSGPAGIRGCLYHFGATPNTYVEVWSLRSGGSGLYASQTSALPGNGTLITPLHLAGVTGVVGREASANGTTGVAFSYARVRGAYVNWMVRGARTDGVKAVTTLTKTAAAEVLRT